MVDITLAPHERDLAAWVGVRRNDEAKRQGLCHKAGYKGDGQKVNIEGAGGELAVAKALNVYWDGSVNTFKQPDLQGGLQVRTRSRHDYDLIIRPGDAPEERYILVTGQMPHYRIQGWARGVDVMLPQYFKSPNDRPEAYFVPASKLQPIETLLHRETN
jgi:hypothetical protein